MTLAQAAKLYDRLRSRFYLDSPPPFHVPPTASDLRWSWLTPSAADVARTVFDQDGDPEEIRVSARFHCWMQADLLHELSHMRLGVQHVRSCRRGGNRAWRQETERLLRLGARLL